MSQPIQATANVARACEVIRDGIRKGTYPGGAWIREMAIAELAQVSRTSVRQALNVLALEGFVELHPNRGAMVIDWSDDNLLEVFDVRVMLESYACELAAQRATAEDIEQLAREADRFSALVERPALKPAPGAVTASATSLLNLTTTCTSKFFLLAATSGWRPCWWRWCRCRWSTRPSPAMTATTFAATARSASLRERMRLAR